MVIVETFTVFCLDACISQPTALCLRPGSDLDSRPQIPNLGLQFVFTGPGPQVAFTSPGPQFAFKRSGPQFLFNCSGPWHQIFFYLPLPFRSLGLHVPTLSPQFVFICSSLFVLSCYEFSFSL